jgi:CheY-like chemotaxis protein
VGFGLERFLGERTVNILCLENHAIFAEQVTRQLLRAHQVTIVPSLVAARSALASTAFDLILSDYDLDDGKGETFVRECRAALPGIPIIAVSSHEAGNAKLIAAGASAVCSKMEFNRIQQVISGLNYDCS